MTYMIESVHMERSFGYRARMLDIFAHTAVSWCFLEVRSRLNFILNNTYALVWRASPCEGAGPPDLLMPAVTLIVSHFFVCSSRGIRLVCEHGTSCWLGGPGAQIGCIHCHKGIRYAVISVLYMLESYSYVICRVGSFSR